MAYADPERERAYQVAWRRAHPGYSAEHRAADRLPISRQQALDEDLAQQRALAALEARHIGTDRAMGRLRSYELAERRWIRATWAPPVAMGGPDARD